MAESYNSQYDEFDVNASGTQKQAENTYDTAEVQNKSVWENIKSKVTEFLNNIKEGIKTVFQDIREYTGALVYRASTGKEEREMLLKEDILKDRKAQEKQEELDRQAKEDLDKILKGTEEKSEPEKQNEKEKQEPKKKSIEELVNEVTNAGNELDIKVFEAEKRFDAIQDSVYSSEVVRLQHLQELSASVDGIKKEMGEFSEQQKNKLPDDIAKLNKQLDKIQQDINKAVNDKTKETTKKIKDDCEKMKGTLEEIGKCATPKDKAVCIIQHKSEYTALNGDKRGLESAKIGGQKFAQMYSETSELVAKYKAEMTKIGRDTLKEVVAEHPEMGKDVDPKIWKEVLNEHPDVAQSVREERIGIIKEELAKAHRICDEMGSLNENPKELAVYTLQHRVECYESLLAAKDLMDKKDVKLSSEDHYHFHGQFSAIKKSFEETRTELESNERDTMKEVLKEHPDLREMVDDDSIWREVLDENPDLAEQYKEDNEIDKGEKNKEDEECDIS